MTGKNCICSVFTILLFQWMGNGAMAQGKYDLNYSVGFDTAAHYLNVELTYTNKEGTNPDELALVVPLPAFHVTSIAPDNTPGGGRRSWSPLLGPVYVEGSSLLYSRIFAILGSLLLSILML